jgi:hypothetical protein
MGTARSRTLLVVRRDVVAILASALWLNASEVWRYFAVVMPATRRYLAVLPGVAPMNASVFAIWGLWDTLLLAACLLTTAAVVAARGALRGSAIIGGTLAWIFFPLFWIAMVNMRLAEPTLLLETLPLSWIEMVVTAALYLRLRR